MQRIESEGETGEISEVEESNQRQLPQLAPVRGKRPSDSSCHQPCSRLARGGCGVLRHDDLTQQRAPLIDAG